MKRYKIVQHFTAPDDCIFRIYKRVFLFLWTWQTSYTTVERCEHAIASWIEEEHAKREAKLNIPKSRVIGYV